MSGDAGAMPSSLDGILVADFSHVLSGPYATMTLGDLGAEVIRVEHPSHGDQTRSWGPPYYDGESAYFISVNRNKRSVQLDFSSDADLAAAKRLVSRADVVIQNFRPGVMDAFGLGFDESIKINPRLVYCSISAFGAAADEESLPGYDLLVQAASGLMSITGTTDGQPVKVGVAVADVVAGLNATVGILAALQHRANTGRGQHVRVNLFTSMLSALVNQASNYLTGGGDPRPMGTRHPNIAPYEVFQTGTTPVAIAAGTDRQFESLARVLDLSKVMTSGRFSTNELRVRNRSELAELLGGAMRREQAEDLIPKLTVAGVPCAPVHSVAEAFDYAMKMRLDPVLEIDRADGAPVPQVASPIQLSDSPVTYRLPPPRLGADTAVIIEHLLSDEESN